MGQWKIPLCRLRRSILSPCRNVPNVSLVRMKCTGRSIVYRRSTNHRLTIPQSIIYIQFFPRREGVGSFRIDKYWFIDKRLGGTPTIAVAGIEAFCRKMRKVSCSVCATVPRSNRRAAHPARMHLGYRSKFSKAGEPPHPDIGGLWRSTSYQRTQTHLLDFHLRRAAPKDKRSNSYVRTVN